MEQTTRFYTNIPPKKAGKGEFGEASPFLSKE
jgi:hypothetical protein